MRRRAATWHSGASRMTEIFWCACRSGLKHGKILLPKGFIQGQKLQETLRQLTLPFSNSTDFDLLPTPFRAVATDLVTGNAVLLDKGDLAIAMRASISAPGLFAPVEPQGLLLVDGGLAENLPIDVARADARGYSHRLRREFSAAAARRARLGAVDLQPDAGDLGAQGRGSSARHLGLRGYFDRAGAGHREFHRFHRGELDHRARAKMRRAACSARLDALQRRRCGLSRVSGAARGARARTAAIKFVRVDEQSKRYEKTIMAEMQPLVGKPLDVDCRRRADHGFVRPRQFRDAGLHAGRSKAHGARLQESGLEVRARRKSWGPNYVRFGLNLEDNFQGNSRYNAAARFILTELDDLGAELVTDVQIGSDPKVASEFYQPLNATRTWFIAPSVRIEARDLQIYVKDDEMADFRDREAEADFDIGRNLGNWGEIRAGYHRINGATRVRLGDPTLVEPQYNNGEFFFKFSYDRLDNLHFPREGQPFTLQWDANRTDLGADIASDKVQADWLMARSLGRNTLLLWTSAGSVVGGNIKPTAMPDLFSLGGFFNLSGLAPKSLFGPNYAIARAIYFRKIGRGGEGFFEFPAYIGMSLEAGNTWQTPQRHEFRIDAQGCVAVPCLRYLSWPGVPGLGLRHRGAQRLLSVLGDF